MQSPEGSPARAAPIAARITLSQTAELLSTPSISQAHIELTNLFLYNPSDLYIPQESLRTLYPSSISLVEAEIEN